MNAGKHPSVASLFLAFAEAGEQDAQRKAQVVGPRRPTRVQLTGPGSGTDRELMARLERQVLGGTKNDVMELLAMQAQDNRGDAE
ncbi:MULTISPECIES: hypothetical protein [unclassified Streptomyces]|uniref:hypothetical protein n=1 Tax=unclassified Streptomyces TaxID=2593676 RepID=UPI00344576F2